MIKIHHTKRFISNLFTANKPKSGYFNNPLLKCTSRRNPTKHRIAARAAKTRKQFRDIWENIILLKITYSGAPEKWHSQPFE